MPAKISNLKNFRSERGKVLPGPAVPSGDDDRGSILADEATRQHNSEALFFISFTALCIALAPAALAGVGVWAFLAFSGLAAGLSREALKSWGAMWEAVRSKSFNDGIRMGRRQMRREIEMGLWDVELRVAEHKA